MLEIRINVNPKSIRLKQSIGFDEAEKIFRLSLVNRNSESKSTYLDNFDLEITHSPPR